MLGRSCSRWNIKEIKVNLRNHRLNVTPSVHIYLYIYCHHFENEHHFEFESIKNEFFDLRNLLKHVFHIEILQNMRYIHCFIFSWRPFQKVAAILTIITKKAVPYGLRVTKI